MLSEAAANAALDELINSGKVYPEDVAPVREYIASLKSVPTPKPAKKAKKAKKTAKK